jgi:hypothetical protein
MSGRPFGALRERFRDTVREVAATAQTALGNLDTGALVSAASLPTPPRQTDARATSEEVGDKALCAGASSGSAAAVATLPS